MKKFFMIMVMTFLILISNLYSQSGWTYYKYKDLLVPGASFCIQSEYNGGIFLGSTGGLMKHNGSEWVKIYYNELNPMETYNKFNIRQVKPSLDVVWASTNEGLIKFTGNERKHYNVSNTPKMYDDKIRGIALDKYGNTWFVNQTLGIFKLEKSSDNVVYYSVPQSTPLPYAVDIPMFCDAYDNLWYSCAEKFVKFSEGNIKVIDETEIPELKSDTVSSIQIMSDNSIIVLMERNIGIYKDNNGEVTFNKIEIPIGLMNDNEYFAKVKMDLEGNCWILSRIYDSQTNASKYFYKYSKNQEWTKYEFPTFEGTNQNLYSLSDFTIDENGKVWFSEPYYGVFVFDSKTTSVENENSRNIMNIAPNPATDFITINMGSIGACSNENNNGSSPIASIEIYDVIGVLVAQTPTSVFNSQTENSELLRIDISHLPAGVYFVKAGNRFEKFVKI